MQSPIGIFDSGYGGLTVLKEIQKQLPQYDYIYLGDNARTPYGNRSFETIYHYTWQCVQWLFKKNCPLIILACNTASAKALSTVITPTQESQRSRHHAPERLLKGLDAGVNSVFGLYHRRSRVLDGLRRDALKIEAAAPQFTSLSDHLLHEKLLEFQLKPLRKRPSPAVKRAKDAENRLAKLEESSKDQNKGDKAT